jgi:hypothetical protein
MYGATTMKIQFLFSIDGQLMIMLKKITGTCGQPVPVICL